ncbi:MAG: Spy/CpxP family protein refolding chaperone, partial [Acidobacteriota bacterium]
HGDRRGGHFGDLNLTADQKTAAHTLRKDMEAKAEPIWTQAREQMKTIESMLEAGNADATELGNKMITAHATRTQLKALRDDFDTKFSALLNADQLAKFQQFQAARKQSHDRMPEPPPGD